MEIVAQRLARALEERYVLERELGRGGSDRHPRADGRGAPLHALGARSHVCSHWPPRGRSADSSRDRGR